MNLGLLRHLTRNLPDDFEVKVVAEIDNAKAPEGLDEAIEEGDVLEIMNVDCFVGPNVVSIHAVKVVD